MSRGSYDDKNDLKKQTEIINSLLPCYGIKNLNDHSSSVSSRSNIDIEGVLSQWDSIQSFFKMSTIVKPSTYSQAIALIKNLCIQARIPFGWEKRNSSFFFSIVPENTFLEDVRKRTRTEREVKPLSFLLGRSREIKTDLDNRHVIISDSFRNTKSSHYCTPDLFINYKIGNSYYRIVKEISKRYDIILSLDLVWKNKQNKHRKFGVINTPFARPNTVYEKETKVDIPLYCLPYYRFYLVLEVTEEEAKKNLPIEFDIKYEYLQLSQKDRSSYKIDYTFPHFKMEKLTYYPLENKFLDRKMFRVFFYGDSSIKLSYPISYAFDRDLTAINKSDVVKTRRYDSIHCDNLDKPIEIECHENNSRLEHA